MVIVMTNEAVSAYDITDEEYLNNMNNQQKLDERLIHREEKSQYLPQKMLAKLGTKASKIDSYYCDTGDKMKKKHITDFQAIRYYNDSLGNRWPSIEYYQTKEKEVAVDLVMGDLISFDSQLNVSSHIYNLLSPEKRLEFENLYSSEEYQLRRQQGISKEIVSVYPEILERFYQVTSTSKLIVRNSKQKLTAKQLKDTVFLIVAKAGLKENGDTTYFIKEFKISDEDTINCIEKIFKRILKENNITKGNLSDKLVYYYYNQAAKEYISNFLFEVQEPVKSNSHNIITEETKTWDEYKKEFMEQYGYVVGELDDNWLDYSSYLVDARKFNDYTIEPLSIEYHMKNIKYITEEVVETFKPEEVGQDVLITAGGNVQTVTPDTIEANLLNSGANVASKKTIGELMAMDRIGDNLLGSNTGSDFMATDGDDQEFVTSGVEHVELAELMGTEATDLGETITSEAQIGIIKTSADNGKALKPGLEDIDSLFANPGLEPVSKDKIGEEPEADEDLFKNPGLEGEHQNNEDLFDHPVLEPKTTLIHDIEEESTDLFDHPVLEGDDKGVLGEDDKLFEKPGLEPDMGVSRFGTFIMGDDFPYQTVYGLDTDSYKQTGTARYVLPGLDTDLENFSESIGYKIDEDGTIIEEKPKLR